MQELPRLAPHDVNALIRQAQAQRAAYVRDLVLRAAQWLFRGAHRATHAH